MKEFNIEEAKAGKPVCTRDGKNVRILCFGKKGDEYPIVVLVSRRHDDGDEHDSIETYSNNGRYFHRHKSPYDLMMKTEKHSGWINIFRQCCKDAPSDFVYPTKEEAIQQARFAGSLVVSYVDTIKIEWEE